MRRSNKSDRPALSHPNAVLVDSVSVRRCSISQHDATLAEVVPLLISSVHPAVFCPPTIAKKIIPAAFHLYPVVGNHDTAVVYPVGTLVGKPLVSSHHAISGKPVPGNTYFLPAGDFLPISIIVELLTIFFRSEERRVGKECL